MDADGSNETNLTRTASTTVRLVATALTKNPALRPATSRNHGSLIRARLYNFAPPPAESSQAGKAGRQSFHLRFGRPPGAARRCDPGNGENPTTCELSTQT